MWLVSVGFIVSSKLGTSSFQKAILSGRILDLTVKFGLSPRYSSLSAVYGGQIVPTDVGLFGFLQCMGGRKEIRVSLVVSLQRYEISCLVSNKLKAK